MAIANPPNTLLDEIIDFLASAPSAEGILAFNASEPLNDRLHYLLDQNSENRITPQEREELDEFLRMGHFMTMLKIRTRQKLKST